MSDIAIEFKGDHFDIEVLNGDLKQDDGLETAIIISLFSNRRVTAEELPTSHDNKQGYWADQFADALNDKTGSRLWTLQREKRQVEVLRRAEDYARESLGWLIEDGVASSVLASAQFMDGVTNAWELMISVQRPSGRTSRYQVLWDKQAIKRVS